jgi:hypothetical protein
MQSLSKRTVLLRSEWREQQTNRVKQSLAMVVNAFDCYISIALI